MKKLQINPRPTRQQRRLDPAKKYGLAGILVGMGIVHFAADDTVEKIIPPQLPGSARFYNYASGVWEIATGALLANDGTRRLGGLSAATLFLAVWPANMYHAYLEREEEGAKRLYHVLRLPAQIPLIEYARRIWKGRA